MAAWPSGKAEACKAFIPQFESGCRLLTRAIGAVGSALDRHSRGHVFESRIAQALLEKAFSFLTEGFYRKTGSLIFLSKACNLLNVQV